MHNFNEDIDQFFLSYLALTVLIVLLSLFFLSSLINELDLILFILGALYMYCSLKLLSLIMNSIVFSEAPSPFLVVTGLTLKVILLIGFVLFISSLDLKLIGIGLAGTLVFIPGALMYLFFQIKRGVTN